MIFGREGDNTPSKWVGILDADEKIVWLGRPSGGLRATRTNLLTTMFGALFIAPSLMALPFFGGESGRNFNVIGVAPAIAIGLYLIVGQHIFAAILRLRTWYALTNRRALILTDVLSRKLRSWPITEATLLDYSPGEEATIFFATESRSDSDGGLLHRRVGFEYINDGQRVYELIRKVQAGSA